MSCRALPRFALAVLSAMILSLPVFSDSHVRIVRLSYIEGGVQIDRNTGRYEKAIVNLPITEGAKLRTEADGRAEVEFEDGSTLRVAPSTTVQFSQLSLRDSGVKVSVADVESGTVYADAAGAKGNDFTIEFGHQTLNLIQATRLRIVASDQGAAVAVFKGDVQVEGPSGAVQLKKNQTAMFGASPETQATISKNIEPEPLDSWDKQQSQYHQRYASKSYNSYSPYAYGTSDLSYYGTFFSAPGYGMLWQPYLIGAGWNPFMDGAWAFSPGFGYGWISSYPWGWTPYHYGTWLFLPGYGWAWQPGGAWMPWYSQPQLLSTPSGFRPPQPPNAVAGQGVTIVPVHGGPVTSFGARQGNKVEIKNNSAGIGVPRGQISNLSKLSRQVEQRGTVTQRIHPAAVPQPAPSIQSSGSPRGTEVPRGPSPGPSSAPRPSAPAPAPRMSSPGPSMSSPPPRISAPAPPPASPHK